MKIALVTVCSAMPAPQVMSAADARRDAVLGLFLQHQSMLGGFLHGLSADRELTEAALQDCAVASVCARWHRFAPGTDFGAWVRTIARQRLREAVRRRGRLGDVDDLGEELGDADWAACEGRDAERKDALAGCLRELPERDRGADRDALPEAAAGGGDRRAWAARGSSMDSR